MADKITAGRDNLGDFAPEFAHFNDDVLFGEVWSREDKLSAHDRSMITIAALMSAYCGWPKAWSAFNLAKEVYADKK